MEKKKKADQIFFAFQINGIPQTAVKSLTSVEKRDNNCNSSSSSALSAQKEVKSLDTAEVQQNLFQCRKLKDYLKCFITVTTKENRHFMRMFQDTSKH